MRVKKFLLFLLFEMIRADTILVELQDKSEVEFNITEILGDGSFGIVFKGVYKISSKDEGKEAAFKISINNEGYQEIDNELRIYKHVSATLNSDELELQQAIDAGIPVVYAFGYIKKCRFDTIALDVILVEHSVLIMEFAGTELFQFILDDSGDKIRMGRHIWLQIAIMMFKAIAFLHRKGVIHGDIKLENFAIEVIGESEVKLRLLDFGGARLMGEKKERVTGSYYYCSYCTTIRLLQMDHCLPDDFESYLELVPDDPDENDDLDSLIISLADIVINGMWIEADNKYHLYEKIHMLAKDIEILPKHEQEEAWRQKELSDDESKVTKVSAEDRVLTMKKALWDILKFKKSFPEDLRGLTKEADIPNAAVELMIDVLKFARRFLPNYRRYSMKIEEFEAEVVKRLEVIAANCLQDHPTNSSAQNSSANSNINDMKPNPIRTTNSDIKKKGGKEKRKGFCSFLGKCAGFG